MNKITKNRYEEIKKIALDCINEFEQNKNGYDTIEYYLNKYVYKFKNKEEQILFRNMVIFPNSKIVLDEFKKDKTLKTFCQKHFLKKEVVQSKISTISCYENLYEDTGLLNISSVDVLGINSDIIKFNKRIDDTIKMLNERKNKKVNRFKK